MRTEQMVSHACIGCMTVTWRVRCRQVATMVQGPVLDS